MGMFGLIKTEQGKALIRTRIGEAEPKVFFTGAVVFPVSIRPLKT